MSVRLVASKCAWRSNTVYVSIFETEVNCGEPVQRVLKQKGTLSNLVKFGIVVIFQFGKKGRVSYQVISHLEGKGKQTRRLQEIFKVRHFIFD